MSLEDVKSNIKSLGPNVVVPPVFQWQVLEKEARSKIKQVRASPGQRGVKDLLEAIGIWNAAQATWSTDAPTLSAVGKATNKQKLKWMMTKLIDEMLIPCLLKGEEESRTVVMLAEEFVSMFEARGPSLDDSSMQTVEQVFTGMRCIRAAHTKNPEVQGELVNDVVETWQRSSSKERTPLGLIAKAIDTNDFWRALVEPIKDNPTAYREQGAELAAISSQVDAIKEADDFKTGLSTLRMACDKVLDFKACFDGRVLESFENKCWVNISAMFEKFKKSIETDDIPCVSAADMGQFLSYAQLAFPAKGVLEDMVAENASIMLARDGIERKARVIEVCSQFITSAESSTGEFVVHKWAQSCAAAATGAKGLEPEENDAQVLKAALGVFVGYMFGDFQHPHNFNETSVNALEKFAAWCGPLGHNLQLLVSARRLCDTANVWMQSMLVHLQHKDAQPAKSQSVFMLNDCAVLREGKQLVLQLQKAMNGLPVTYVEVKNAMAATVDDTSEIHKECSEMAVSFKAHELKTLGEELQKLVVDAGTGLPFHEVAQKLPWPDLLAKYAPLLSAGPHDGIAKKLKVFTVGCSGLHDMCQALEFEEPVIPNKAVLADHANLAVCARKLVVAMEGSDKADKVKLRKLVLAEMNELMSPDNAEPLRLQKLLPSSMRAKIDKAIKMKGL